REPGRVSHLEGRRVLHGLELARDRLDDLPPAVTGVHAPQSRHRIEDLTPLGRPVVHAARLREQSRLRLELTVGGEGHPERFEFGSAHGGGGVGHGLLGEAWMGGGAFGLERLRMINKVDKGGYRRDYFPALV